MRPDVRRFAASPLADAIQADYDQHLGALWDHFHRNPELSFREFNTAARMAQDARQCVSAPRR